MMNGVETRFFSEMVSRGHVCTDASEVDRIWYVGLGNRTNCEDHGASEYIPKQASLLQLMDAYDVIDAIPAS